MGHPSMRRRKHSRSNYAMRKARGKMAAHKRGGGIPAPSRNKGRH